MDSLHSSNKPMRKEHLLHPFYKGGRCGIEKVMTEVTEEVGGRAGIQTFGSMLIFKFCCLCDGWGGDFHLLFKVVVAGLRIK